MGRARKRAVQAARWAARTSRQRPAPSAPDDNDGVDGAELDLGAGRTVYLWGPPEFRADQADIWRESAASVDARRARADAENQKTSAPCDACGRPMSAADRCADCRASGMWFCSACHTRFAAVFAPPARL